MPLENFSMGGEGWGDTGARISIIKGEPNPIANENEKLGRVNNVWNTKQINGNTKGKLYEMCGCGAGEFLLIEREAHKRMLRKDYDDIAITKLRVKKKIEVPSDSIIVLTETRQSSGTPIYITVTDPNTKQMGRLLGKIEEAWSAEPTQINSEMIVQGREGM